MRTSVAAPSVPLPDASAAEAKRNATALFAAKILGDPSAAELSELQTIAGQLDVLLADTAQDLGLSLDLGRRGAAPDDEIDLVASAEAMRAMLIAPSIRERDGDIELRLLLAEPGSRKLVVRVERVARADLELRAVVMLRDLVTDRSERAAETKRAAAERKGSLTVPARSVGKTALAINATLFGGLVGYSIQRASGSDDPRLLYPLLAVGAGGGLVASVLAAEEWDIGVGDAWFLASGAWWPTLAGHLIHASRFGAYAPQPRGAVHEGEQWTAGLVASATGLSLATLGLAWRGASEGDAAMAHSGAGLGLVFGGIAEAFVRGDVGTLPMAGLGYGAGLGWLGAAALSLHLRPSTTRVVGVDLGVLMGGLGGAALGSPLLLDAPTPTQQRIWLGITGGMAILGGAIGWYAMRPKVAVAAKPKKKADMQLPVPMFGLIGESRAGERRAPVMGLMCSGVWQ
ncbi:MAG: hypothetical protein IPM54_45510 [Polyangiaceae bacterium]|nr:hypothetical protein [Polyangiaceae bacterium]